MKVIFETLNWGEEEQNEPKPKYNIKAMKEKSITKKQQELVDFIKRKMFKYKITELYYLKEIKDRYDAWEFIDRELEWANRMDNCEKGLPDYYYTEPSFGDN